MYVCCLNKLLHWGPEESLSFPGTWNSGEKEPSNAAFKLQAVPSFKIKKKKKLHLNTITRVPFLLTAAQKNIMAPIVWKPAAICHIIMSAAALIRNPLGKVSEVASAIASSHTSVLLHIWNFICLLSQHRFPHSNCLFWERGLNVWWEETWVFDPHSSDHRWDWVTEKKGSAQWQ